MPVPRIIGVPWFRREDYDRIRLMSDDEIPESFDEWRHLAQGRFDQLVAAGMPLEKVMIDPEELALFARDAGRKVDAQARAALAAILVAQKYRHEH